jgi:drug/metabolite transporter (DMT)-like permease
MTKALHSSMAGEVVPFKYLGAIYALLMGYVIFDERLHQLSLTGMALIVFGVMGSQWLKHKPTKKETQNP